MEQATNINQILRAELRVSRWGAPIGDSDRYSGSIKLRLQRVRLIDGDYGPDGTYWGGGYGVAPLWCAFNATDATHAVAQGTRIYVRARSRAGAKAEILKAYVNVRFYR